MQTKLKRATAAGGTYLSLLLFVHFLHLSALDLEDERREQNGGRREEHPG